MKHSEEKSDYMQECAVPLVIPFFPPLEDFESYICRIRDSHMLTNNGPIVHELERELSNYLGVKCINLCANGTIALMIALKALNLKGEVITTPFTSVATLQTISWNGLTPIFADINRDDLTLDTNAIRDSITLHTSAILPVHVFGNPCNVEEIDRIAKEYDLKTIYDAAHCFGVTYNGRTLCDYGDLSVLSFHATKVFSCIEGGAIVSNDENKKQLIDSLVNYSYKNHGVHEASGFNSKMNEIQAAFGMVSLKHTEEIIRLRKQASLIYEEELLSIEGISMIKQKETVVPNYTYMPILIDEDLFGQNRDETARELENCGIITRKYFYPLACDIPPFNRYKTEPLPVAEEIARKVLCLPLYHDIKEEQILFVTGKLREIRKRKR
jgi:dTDP-4-amino-4,6-dideoxy-D-glucose transaminase